MDGSEATTRTRSTSNHDSATRHARSIFDILMHGYRGRAAIRLWDGSRVAGPGDAPCTAVFRDPSVIRAFILNRDLVRAAEAYLTGLADIEGKVELLFDAVEFLQRRESSLGPREKASLLWHAWRMPSRPRTETLDSMRASKAASVNSRESIGHHYDVGNEFYRLFLDPELVYSCAYFRDRDRSLAQAQHDKLDIICRKLRLEQGDRLLDIGCGWGALVLWAARHYGVKAHGITLSRQQHELAQERIREAGLGDRVRVELRDYRELDNREAYDKVVSVGMFEHIGPDAYPEYFGIIRRVMRPGGVLLNHGIVNDSGWQDNAVRRFLKRYVFPDGSLTRISEVITAMENAGFEILDAESLRRHYALTLRHWINNLERNRKRAVELVGEPTFRVWQLYMSGSAYFFEQGGINIFQVLAGRARARLEIPLTREDIYV